MDRIEWSNRFSVGHSLLNEQHMRIIKMINMLITDPEATVYSETVSELLNRLTMYSREHFRKEEEILSEYDYPELALQKEEHKDYRIKVGRLCTDTIIHSESVPSDLLNFLKNWWEHHILKSDMKYKSFLEKKTSSK